MSKQNTAAEHGTSASEAADCKLRDGVDLEQYIRISADSIGELRKVDVYRVISSVRSGNVDGVTRRDLATYIAAKRHDLVAEVTDVMREDFPQDDWAADCVAGRKMLPTPDDVHRVWLANLKKGDRVEVPYSVAKEDIKLMTVFENDGVWIRLLPDGFSKGIDNTVLVDAVSGVLHYRVATMPERAKRTFFALNTDDARLPPEAATTSGSRRQAFTITSPAKPISPLKSRDGIGKTRPRPWRRCRANQPIRWLAYVDIRRPFASRSKATTACA